MSRNNRLVYAWQRGVKAQPQNGGGRLRPLEATRDYKNPTAIQKAEWQSTVTPRLFALLGYGRAASERLGGQALLAQMLPGRAEFVRTRFSHHRPRRQRSDVSREPFAGRHILVPLGDPDEPGDAMLGRLVGAYRIEKRIASGGMGTVYLGADNGRIYAIAPPASGEAGRLLWEFQTRGTLISSPVIGVRTVRSPPCALAMRRET